MIKKGEAMLRGFLEWIGISPKKVGDIIRLAKQEGISEQEWIKRALEERIIRQTDMSSVMSSSSPLDNLKAAAQKVFQNKKEPVEPDWPVDFPD